MKGNATVVLVIRPKGVTAKDKFIKMAQKTSLVSKTYYVVLATCFFYNIDVCMW